MIFSFLFIYIFVVNIVYFVVHIVCDCEVDVIANSLVLYLPFCLTLNKNFFLYCSMLLNFFIYSLSIHNFFLWERNDSVHYFQDARLLVAGSRDRILNIFDLSKIDIDRPETANSAMVFSKLNAHQVYATSVYIGMVSREYVCACQYLFLLQTLQQARPT